jgi:trans-AT polyketide synthase/acyltransferase/oxidoreductase domain-containing protein
VATTTGVQALERALGNIHQPFLLRPSRDPDGLPDVLPPEETNGRAGGDTLHVPALHLEHLGDPSFCTELGIRFPYLAGAMANGIASVELVEALARAGLVGFFGAAGLAFPVVEAAVERLSKNLGRLPHGFNLIHSPGEPELEAAVADLYLRRGVRLVEASAYLDLTLPIVRYRLHGLHRSPSGTLVTPNRVVAKVSRVEVASKFLAPAPAAMIRELVQRGDLTTEQAELATRVPVAQDLTAEADSAGHTDNRPALALLPTLLALRDRLHRQHGYAQLPRVGAAGGIATPAATAAAFAMGAAYVLTGSVNQACLEAGSSDLVRTMLAEAEQADCTMAPAADMFEMGVKVQVLKRGTLFAMRAAKLYELYRARAGLEELTPSERGTLEKTIFRAPLEEIWQQCCEFFQRRDPRQLELAAKDARHKMALVFRWYLGQSSRWANAGVPDRKIDYQVWCGPAMGAFNEWTRGSFLEQPKERRVVTVALNLLYGAAVLLRASGLRYQGVRLPAGCPQVAPLPLAELETRLRERPGGSARSA